MILKLPIGEKNPTEQTFPKVRPTTVHTRFVKKGATLESGFLCSVLFSFLLTESVKNDINPDIKQR